MAKWANYLISGIWMDKNEVITHVMLHRDDDATMTLGEKTSVANVISKIKNNYTVMTIRWNYLWMRWSPGAQVIVVKEGTTEYLRTKKDSETIDNLDNLIDMAFFKMEN